MRKKLGKFNKAVQWQVDCNYYDDLDPEAQEYLKKFLGEYYDHRFSDDPIHPLVLKTTEGEINTKKDAMDRENRARRDVMNRFKQDSEIDVENISQEIKTPTKFDKSKE